MDWRFDLSALTGYEFDFEIERAAFTVRPISIAKFIAVFQRYPGFDKALRGVGGGLDAAHAFASGKPAFELAKAAILRKPWRFSHSSKEAFGLAMMASFGITSPDEFFEKRKEGKKPSGGLVRRGGLPNEFAAELAKDAIFFELKSGRDGFALSPFQLSFRLRALADLESGERKGTASAVSVGFSGDKKSWERL